MGEDQGAHSAHCERCVCSFFPSTLPGLTTVNSISWAPYELGPIIACASSDGKISVLSFQSAHTVLKRRYEHSRLTPDDGSADASTFPAHGTGANAVSWAPAVISNETQSGQSQLAPQKRLVSAGSDNLVRIWNFDDTQKKWVEEEVIRGHDDWVRDVAWAPNIGLPGMYIASASQVGFPPPFLPYPFPFSVSVSTPQHTPEADIQDRTVLIHSRSSPTAAWTSTPLLPNAPESKDPHFPDAVWRVSWSLAGNILAVSCGDGKVSLWKEGVGKGWECVSDFTS